MDKLQKYAKLIVEVGLNVQKGQDLYISVAVENVPFAHLCADAAYDAGAREVTVLFNDDYLTRQKYLRAAPEVFREVPNWRQAYYNDAARAGSAWLNLHSGDPELLAGVDPARIMDFQRAAGKAMAEFYELETSGKFPWCIVSLPAPAWAQKVFPHDTPAAAMEKLWQAVFAAVRVFDGESDPVALWRAHLQTLTKRTEILNKYHFRALHYTNALGTDLTVELPENHIWQGGADVLPNGLPFVANMPTEEIFTAPKANGVNGRAVAALPLVLNGNIVQGFAFTFKDGRVVEASAEQGQELLRQELSADEGASRLGEVALVPYDSPISQSGILYYDTLYDENAACHLALGKAYACVEGGADMDKAQKAAAGLNDSVIHDDFMIGTKDLSITGIAADGSETPVFVNGNFAF